MNIGQFHKLRCRVCSANIETDKLINKCPACGVAIDLSASGEGTGLTTATAEGPGLKPLGGVVKEVY